MQGAVGEVAVGNQCVVAVCIQRPYLRRVFAPPLSWSATTARWAMSLEPELPADAHGPVTTTVTRRIKPGHEVAYEAFLAGISGAARAFPGYLGIEVFRPTPSGHGGEYRTVYRFDSLAHLHGWLDSPERAAWLQRAEPHVAGPMRTQVLTGLEGWFTLPTQPGLPSPACRRRRATRWLCSPGRRSSR